MKDSSDNELARLWKRVSELEQSEAELRKLQRELKESERKWRQLVENIPDVVMTVDRDATILAINHTIPGLTVKEVIGTKLYDYIASEQHDTMLKYLEQAFKLDPQYREIALEDQDLEPLWKKLG